MTGVYALELPSTFEGGGVEKFFFIDNYKQQDIFSSNIKGNNKIMFLSTSNNT
jgi:hypothetical protein